MKTIVTEAPGRVNLIGEHTDYNDGFVLPTALQQRTRVTLSPREDDRVRLASRELEGSIEYRLGEERPSRSWHDYVLGVTKLLAEGGHRLRGFELEIVSDVPVGSGLSSSAALEVAVMRALREAFSLDLSDVAIAQLGQRVENEFVGARVGIMDQMACSLAEPGCALFLDTRDLSYRRVQLPLDRLDLVVINSGISHRNVGGDYNTRRAECETACELLGVKTLREIDESELQRIEALPEPFRRRARHVVTENARVLAAVKALELHDTERLGELFHASHSSMKDDYEVSLPEIDRLVEIGWSDRDIFAARLTGGGFGGSVVMLAKHGAGRAAAARVAERYSRDTDQSPTVLVDSTDDKNRYDA